MNIRKYTENDLSEMIHIWTFFHFCFSYEHNMDLHEKDADGMVGKFNAAFQGEALARLVVNKKCEVIRKR